MIMTVRDRLLIGLIYPEKTNMSENAIIEDINKKVRLTQKDIDKYGIKQLGSADGGGWNWDPKKDKGEDFKFSGAEIEFLRSRVTELDNKKSITRELYPLCLKIRNYDENNVEDRVIVKGKK